MIAVNDWLTFIALSPTEQINKRMHDLTSTDIAQRTFFEAEIKKLVAEKAPLIKKLSFIQSILIGEIDFSSKGIKSSYENLRSNLNP